MPLFLTRAGDVVLNAIFPPRCAGCQTFCDTLFCERCQDTLQPIVAPFCARCGIPFDPLAHAAAECADCRSNRYHGAPPFDALRSAFTFTGAMRPAVHRLKYNGKTALAAPLAAILYELLQNNALPGSNINLICPVPLHPWRRWRRGYNQSALLSENLSRLYGVPYGEVLYRTRRTPPQVGLNEKQRLANVKDAFAVNQKALQKHNSIKGTVLLIDDVCTTGATIAECARVLRKAGMSQIYALTLARQL